MKASWGLGLVMALCCFCCAGAEEYYTYTQIRTPCDVTTTVQMSIDDNEPVEIKSRSHGMFTIVTSANGIVLDRPDLGSTPGSYLSFQCNTGTTCSVLSFAIDNTTSLVFTHREETTYNGHKCYKYYNRTEDVMYADAQGMLWGRVTTLGQKQVLNYSALTFEKHSREDFVLPAGTDCPDHPEAFKAPSEDVFNSACDGYSSSSSTLSPSSTTSVSPSTLTLSGALVSLIALASSLFFF